MSFKLILIDKSVGPQESGQRAAMQCVMSTGGGGAGGAPDSFGPTDVSMSINSNVSFRNSILIRNDAN